MSHSPITRPLLWMSVLTSLLVSNLSAVPTDPGLYAVFNVSWGNPAQAGSFTAKLHYDKAPVAVANFVTLTEGTRSWVQVDTGRVSKIPFYQDTTFHWVMAGFVIQGGSPNGLGSDGPGYAFKDEFHADLRHSAAGKLSMANSGIHSNGGQFIVTLGAAAWLDDAHTLFGEVVENLSIVQAIGLTPVYDGGRPLAKVTLHSVTIVRQGAAAQAWDPLAQPLPVITVGAASLTRSGLSGNDLNIDWPRPGGGQVTTYKSTDFVNWAYFGSGFDHDPRVEDGVELVAEVTDTAQHFFRLVRAQYPDGIRTPLTTLGYRAVMTIDNANGTLIADFTGPTTGSYTYTQIGGTPATGPIDFYYFDPEPLRLRMGINYVDLAGFYTDFSFTSATGGRGKMVRAGDGSSFTFSFVWTPIP